MSRFIPARWRRKDRATEALRELSTVTVELHPDLDAFTQAAAKMSASFGELRLAVLRRAAFDRLANEPTSTEAILGDYLEAAAR